MVDDPTTEKSWNSGCGFCGLTLLVYYAFFASYFYTHPDVLPNYRGWLYWLMAGMFTLGIVSVVMLQSAWHFHLLSGFGGYATIFLVLAFCTLHLFLTRGGIVALCYIVLVVILCIPIVRVLNFFEPIIPDENPFPPRLAISLLLLESALLVVFSDRHERRLWLVVFTVVSVVLIVTTLYAMAHPNHEPTLKPDRFVLRNTGAGPVLIGPGEPYKKKNEDAEFPIRPDRHLFQTPAGARMLHWQPDPENLDAYVEFYRPIRSSARADFIAGLQDFFALNPRPSEDFLQERYAAHFGVKILALDVPPGTDKPPQPVQDDRSPIEREFARMIRDAKSVKQAFEEWERLKATHPEVFKNPDVAEALYKRFQALVMKLADPQQS